jgi:polyisoprenoid-binding protein YceI
MSWVIDNAHTHVGFSVKHMMVSTVRGHFKTYGGTVNLDSKDFTRSKFQGEVEVASIDTNNTDRDNHLKSADFFDAANHPKITFETTRIEPKGEGEFAVQGDLSIRGVTKPVTFTVEFHGTGKNPWGKTVAGLHAHATINRKDFGLNWNAALETGGILVGETVKIELDLEATASE